MALRRVGNKQPGTPKAAGHKPGKPFAPAPRAPVPLSSPGQAQRIAAHQVHPGDAAKRKPTGHKPGKGQGRS